MGIKGGKKEITRQNGKVKIGRGAGAVQRNGLESRDSKGSRGFESHPLRQSLCSG